MKIQTIHKNACGTVVNPISADGIEFTCNGQQVTVTKDGYLHVGSTKVAIEYLEQILVEAFKPLLAGRHVCYQCGRKTAWLAPDSRCSRCTHMTPDEVRGA